MAGAAQTAEGNPWGGGQSPFKMSYGKMMMWFFLVSDAFTFSALLTAYGFMRHRFEEVWPVAGDVFTHFPFYAGHIELAYVGLMTFILIMSSVTMVLAVEAGHRMDQKNVIKWLALTIVGGFIFLGSQAWEWYHFIHGTPDGALMVVGQSILSDGTKLIDGTILQFVDGGLRLPGVNGKMIVGAEAEMLKSAGQIVQGANLMVNEYGVPLFANFFFFITGFHGFHVFSGVVINIIILLKVIGGEFQRKGHYEMVEKTGLYWHFVDLVWVFVFTFFYLL